MKNVIEIGTTISKVYIGIIKEFVALKTTILKCLFLVICNQYILPSKFPNVILQCMTDTED